MRGRLLLAAAASLAAVLPTAAHAATLTIHPATGGPRTVELESLLVAPDVSARAYAVRSRAGATVRRITGVSLAAVLRAADADVDAFGFAELDDGRGRTVLLPRALALRAADDDAPPPVLYPDGDRIGFLRPSAGLEDRNGADELGSVDGLTVRLRERPRLAISVAASDRRPDAGDRVTLTARVRGVAAGERARVSWLIDGRGADGAEVTRRLARRGRVRVLATVTTDEDEIGASSVLTLEVGDAGPEPEPPPSEDDPTADGAGGAGASGGTGTGTGGTGGAGGTVAAQSAAAPQRRRRHAARPTPRPRRATASPKVEGELLENVPSAPPATAAAPARRAPDRPAPTAAGLDGLPPAAWTGLGALALLAFGFGVERRRWAPEGEVA